MPSEWSTRRTGPKSLSDHFHSRDFAAAKRELQHGIPTRARNRAEVSAEITGKVLRSHRLAVVYCGDDGGVQFAVHFDVGLTVCMHEYYLHS
jgi:hypothetical protein